LTLTSMVFFFAVYKQWLLCCRGYWIAKICTNHNRAFIKGES
jgi:hypothetical protein